MPAKGIEQNGIKVEEAEDDEDDDDGGTNSPVVRWRVPR